ncbi:SusC/RagA family TonB-linked outer membrane protein [Cyclobacterium roseum]|uniref:SusC/RagA family TonB-linked outer membrane protein n=1 Tax=Cyclobacterium roseum TaxID=2666137 RepID=UPI001391436E|nr:TonB-dependent receptor [Cyclobacterium roseum]
MKKFYPKKPEYYFYRRKIRQIGIPFSKVIYGLGIFLLLTIQIATAGSSGQEIHPISESNVASNTTNLDLRNEDSGENLNTLSVAIQISGTVTDENGDPLPGATVQEKGTTNVTVTDVDGNFSLTVQDNASLIISFVGFVSYEVEVTNESELEVSLVPDVTSLEEMVVVGYGTQKRSDVTGSVARMNTEKTQDLLNTNILQSLKGSVAGMTIATPDRPGEEPSFRVRGTNSITAGNQPLIVLDGVIYNGSMNNINPNDIETVDILKDASAAAVYGSRSANGVIILTTKKGKTGKPTFNFRANYGISNPVKLIDVLDGPGYIQKVLDFREAIGQEAIPDNVTDYLNPIEAENYQAGRTIDWYEQLVNPSTTQNYNLSISGGNDVTKYFISGTIFDESGIVENDNFERKTVRVNLSNKITDWFKVSLQSSFSNLDYSGVPVDLYYGLSPYSSLRNDDGSYRQFPMDDPFFANPYYSTLIDHSDRRNDLWGMISSELEVPFIPGLVWTSNYSLNKGDRQLNRFSDNRIAQQANGVAFQQSFNNFYSIYDNILNYRKVIKNRHGIDATFLYSREYRKTSNFRAESRDFFNQNLGYYNLGLGAVQSNSSGFSDQNNVGIMGRLNYSFDEKYSVTATLRRDGSSVFAEGNKYATFKALGLGWVISNESFMNSVSLFDRLKLRASYGENGNQAISRYQTLARLASRNAVYGDGSGIANGVFVNSLANNELGWETTEVYNFGLEFGVLGGRLSGTIDYYTSTTSDLLLNRAIPRTSGQGSILSNIGQVGNKGIEIALNSVNVKTLNFSWETGLIFDRQRNEIQKLYGKDEDGDGVEDDDIANRWFIGEPLGTIFGFGIDGVHQAGEGDLPPGYEPGDFRIIDYDGDGELTADDRHILGTSRPNYSFSLSNTVRYKKFSLYVMINAIQGGGNRNFYVGNNLFMHNPNAQFSSWTERFNIVDIDYWTPNNPSNSVARINYIPVRSHPYLEDRSFVRIQDINLGYSFGNELLSKIGFSNLRLYTSIKNLYTFTKWTGYDPENGSSINGFPLMRTITFGIDASF